MPYARYQPPIEQNWAVTDSIVTGVYKLRSSWNFAAWLELVPQVENKTHHGDRREYVCFSPIVRGPGTETPNKDPKKPILEWLEVWKTEFSRCEIFQTSFVPSLVAQLDKLKRLGPLPREQPSKRAILYFNQVIRGRGGYFNTSSARLPNCSRRF